MIDHCIKCGAEVNYDETTPIRSYYIDGLGELCESCARKLHDQIMNDPAVLNGLYYTKLGGGHHLQECKLFSSDELEVVESAADKMERLFMNLDRSTAITDTAGEFKQSLQSLKSADRYSLAVVERRYRAFLFEWRLYTEHWKKYIDGLKNEPDGYVIGYKKLFKDVNVDAYQDDRFVLAIILRNYAAHAVR